MGGLVAIARAIANRSGTDFYYEPLVALKAFLPTLGGKKSLRLE